MFSNEAGLGSAPNVAAVAYVAHPVQQGIVQSFSVFIDTIVICSCTAFIILLSDVYVPGVSGVQGILLTQNALIEHIGPLGGYFVTIALLLFGFSSMIYNYYLAENSLNFFVKGNVLIFNIFKVTCVLLVIWGSLPASYKVEFGINIPAKQADKPEPIILILFTPIFLLV